MKTTADCCGVYYKLWLSRWIYNLRKQEISQSRADKPYFFEYTELDITFDRHF
jgi:hypothetical protein